MKCVSWRAWCPGGWNMAMTLRRSFLWEAYVRLAAGTACMLLEWDGIYMDGWGHASLLAYLGIGIPLTLFSSYSLDYGDDCAPWFYPSQLLWREQYQLISMSP